MPLALSGTIAAATVTALPPPFANTHFANPAGLPSYGTFVSRGQSEGSFSSSEKTGDAPERVLDFYEQNIDRTIWTIPSRGRMSLAFVLQADPRMRGGVVVTTVPGDGTYITLFVRDLQLPAGFPLDFPASRDASVLVPGEVSNGLAHLRWGVGPDYPHPFIDDFAQILDDAGWSVVTKSSTSRPPSLTCRSRARPELSCRIAVSVEPDPRWRGQFRTVADVWVGIHAEDAR